MEIIDICSNVIDLELEFGNKTRDEIIDDSEERLEFPTKDLECNIELLLALKEKKGYIEKYNDGKYHLLDIDFGLRKEFIEDLKSLPDGYFNERQHMRKLKEIYDARGFLN